MKHSLLAILIAFSIFGFGRTLWAEKPNIVLIYADDWGWGDLSCHGSTWVNTPNLDKLASQGTDFLQFNVLNPVCSPSRTAVMTGNYPARFCVHQQANRRRCSKPEEA